jgi:hypothetical protein
MRVELFQKADYVKARLVNNSQLQNWKFFNGVIPMLDYMEQSQTFWTVWDGESVVLIAGYHRVWPDVSEVSLFPTESFVAQPFGALRLLKIKLDWLQKECRRIQLNCRNEECFVKFALRLGFVKEGVLHKFGFDGTDHIMMAIVEGA